MKTSELVPHKDASEDDKVSPGLSEPLTGRHMSQIGLDKAHSSRVRPQQGACVPVRERLAAPSAGQHSSVCATNPNEATPQAERESCPGGFVSGGRRKTQWSSAQSNSGGESTEP